MKKLVFLLSLILSSSCLAQKVRIDIPLLTTGPTQPTPSGALPIVLAIPGSTITLCNADCSAPLVTYTSSQGTTTCSSSTPLTMQQSSTCVAKTDSSFDIGFWYDGGSFKYSVTAPYGVTFGPYDSTGPASGGSTTFGFGPPSGTCSTGSIYYNTSTIPYPQYVCNGGSWVASGGGGGFSGTLSQPLYSDPVGIVESGAGLLASFGCNFMGDSNSGGAGLGLQYAWTTLAYSALNCKAPATNFPINVAGDNSKDFANRSFGNFSPLDQGNPIFALQYSTNTLKYENLTVPTTARRLSYQTTLAAGISNLAMSVNDKYMPTTQPTVSTSYAINSNNTAIMQAVNGYNIGQQLLLTNCTSTTGLLFNAINTGVTVTAASPTSFSFFYNTNYVPQSSTADACTITPSVSWALSGGWGLVSPFDSFNITGLGAGQGIGYQVGNLLTIPCSGGNAVARVSQVVTTTPPGSFTVNITSVDGGGHITGVSLNNPGTASPVTGSYWFVTGGNGDAIVQQQNAPNTYNPINVTLISGGSGGYSSGTNIPISAQGQLYVGGFKINQLGSGCVNNPSFTASCSAGTGTSCGQYGNFSNTVGPQMYRTSTGGTMTLSNVQVGGGADANTGGDIKVWYPVGSNYGGNFTVTDTPSGGSPTVLTDTWTGNSTLSEVDSTPEITENFATGDTFQEAHFKVAPGVSHSFSITCASGTNCGILGMGIPPSTHNTGVNAPNATVGGAFLIGNTGPLFGTSTCGQTAPGSCATVFSSYIAQVVNELAKVEGLNVNYFDNQNILPVFDYLNSGTGVSTLIQNRVSNYTNSLHGDSYFHIKLSNNLLAALKAVPAPSTTGNFSTGLISYTNANAGQYTGFFSTPPTPLFPPNTPQYTTTNASLNLFAPLGFGINLCNYPNVSGQNPNFYGPLFTCPHIFTSTGQYTIPNQIASGGTSVNSPSHNFIASAWDAGIIVTSQTGGTGCTGTGVIAPVGGTFTIPAVLQAQCNSGVINALISNAGVYTSPPTGFTNSFAGSAGYNITFDLATNNTPNQSEMWSLQSQIFQGAPVFRIQAPFTSYTGGTIALWLSSASKNGGYKLLMDAPNFPTANTLTLSLAALSTNTQWSINGISGTPMMGASTTPIVNASCIGTDSIGRVILGTCSGSSFITSLTTTGTSGPATVVSGVLNIPQYSGGGGGTTTNALTMNNGGTGATSGSTFNGSAAITLSYNTIGAAPLASPGLTGVPTAPTAPGGTNTVQLATTAFVQAAIAALTSITGSGTNNTLPKFTGTSTQGNSLFTDNGTNGAYTGTGGLALSGPLAIGGGSSVCGSASNCIAFNEASTTGTPAAGGDYLRADSSLHGFKLSLNNGAEFYSLMNYASIDLSTSLAVGNLGVSHLNGGTGASSSTFWRGDGTWAATGGGSSPTFANTTAALGWTQFSASSGSLWLAGDSVMQGLIGSNSNNATTQYAESLPGLIAQETLHPSYPGYNFAVAGTNLNTIITSIYKNFQPPNPTAIAPKVIMDGGINDAVNFNNGGTPTAGQQNQYTSGLIGVIGHVTVPPTNHFAASTCTQTSGTWANNSSFFGNQSAWPGTDLQISSSGGVLTCSFTTTVNNQHVIAVWGAPGVSSGGQFNLAIDGTNQTALCSGTTTYYGYGCNASTQLDRYGQDFTIATSGAHTLTITTINASAVDLVEYLLVPATPTVSAVMVISDVPVQHSSASAAVQSAATVYGGLNSAAVTAEAAAGLPVAFANLRTGSFVINNSTDYTSGGCSYNLGLIPNHPDCIGVTKWANSIGAALNTLGSYSYAGLGIVQPSDISVQTNNNGSTYYTNFPNGITVSNPTAFANFNTFSNINGNSIFGNASTWAPGLQFMTNGSSWFEAIAASVYNTSFPQNYPLAFLSTNGFAFGNCAATAANPGACTWPAFMTSTGNLFINLQGQKIGTAIASATTIAPLSGITHITGTTAIATITAPAQCTTTGTGCVITLIPDGLFTTTTAGNIALASTAVVSKALIMTYDPATVKWYPSY